MAREDLDGLLISVPENLYYLTALDHWGFFACHMLVVPRDGDMILIARAMERITIANQVTNARFLGHADNEDPADFAVRALTQIAWAEQLAVGTGCSPHAPFSLCLPASWTPVAHHGT